MADFRLKVFLTVAKRLSFTKAAQELYISQPAVTKHVHELEQEYQISLFERKGNKIILTEAGGLMVRHGEGIFQRYRSMEFELNSLKDNHKGNLKIGASTTVSQYIIPSVLAKFHERHEHVKVSLMNGNTQQVDQALVAKEIHLGIVEGRSQQPEINYTAFMKDEIVLVGNTEKWIKKKSELTLKELKKIPLLMREQGSGSLEVILHRLKALGVKPTDLHVEMSLGSTESIKSYLKDAAGLAFLSIHSILDELKNQQFMIIDIVGLDICRHFYFTQLQGSHDPLAEVFMRFAKHFQRQV